MIRPAVPTDNVRLVELGEAFFVEAGLPGRGVTFDPRSFAATCGFLADKGILLVAESQGRVVGMLGAQLMPAYWNVEVTLCQECFWFVDKDSRKGVGSALLRELEARATDAGARFCAMVAEHGLRGDAVGRLYKAKGYAPAESVFWRPLGAAESARAA